MVAHVGTLGLSTSRLSGLKPSSSSDFFGSGAAAAMHSTAAREVATTEIVSTFPLALKGRLKGAFNGGSKGGLFDSRHPLISH